MCCVLGRPDHYNLGPSFCMRVEGGLFNCTFIFHNALSAVVTVRAAAVEWLIVSRGVRAFGVDRRIVVTLRVARMRIPIEAGQGFRFHSGHRFRFEAGHHSDLKPAT